jgi:hypothetical protein
MDDQAPKSLPGGRPRKDTATLRDQWLKARVTASELHLVEQWAAEANLKPSEYIRKAVLDGRVEIKRYHAPDPDIGNQLSRIGNNLNQIARICNTTGNDRRARFIEAHIEDELRPILTLLLKQYAP